MSIALHLSFPEAQAPFSISHKDKLFLLGSCFTTHLSHSLAKAKFPIMTNPSGTLFDPLSLSRALRYYRELPTWDAQALVFQQGSYYSWDHHSTLGADTIKQTLENIQKSHEQAHTFLRQANYLVLTLGSAVYYRLKPAEFADSPHSGSPVANCHKFPAANFSRQLADYPEIVRALQQEILAWRRLNPSLRVILSVSPVRYGKNGGNALVENAQSKAQLILATQQLVKQNAEFCLYFPAYEILIDCLRDYRYYASDLIHPNHLATQIITDYFARNFFSASTQELSKRMRALGRAQTHLPRQPNSQAHLDFLSRQLKETQELRQLYPYLDFRHELEYFQNSILAHPLHNPQVSCS